MIQKTPYFSEKVDTESILRCAKCANRCDTAARFCFCASFILAAGTLLSLAFGLGLKLDKTTLEAITIAPGAVAMASLVAAGILWKYFAKRNELTRSEDVVEYLDDLAFRPYLCASAREALSFLSQQDLDRWVEVRKSEVFDSIFSCDSSEDVPELLIPFCPQERECLILQYKSWQATSVIKPYVEPPPKWDEAGCNRAFMSALWAKARAQRSFNQELIIICYNICYYS